MCSDDFLLDDNHSEGVLGGTVSNIYIYICLQRRRLKFNSGSGRSPGRKVARALRITWTIPQIGSLVGYGPQGHRVRHNRARTHNARLVKLTLLSAQVVDFFQSMNFVYLTVRYMKKQFDYFLRFALALLRYTLFVFVVSSIVKPMLF